MITKPAPPDPGSLLKGLLLWLGLWFVSLGGAAIGQVMGFNVHWGSYIAGAASMFCMFLLVLWIASEMDS